MNQEVAVSVLAEEIMEGLSSRPKSIPSKYFYDEEGSLIFTRIMRMPEYYLTDAEFEIFDIYKQEMLDLIFSGQDDFDLIELGAGDGFKTNVLIKHFLQNEINFRYLPIDISEQALEGLVNKMKYTHPGLNIAAIRGDYFNVMGDIRKSSRTQKVVLFLGSNIGNYTHDESIAFLKQLSANMDPGDFLIIGFDLVKNPEIILKAYNDPRGYTEAFNLNLLKRMNREFGADFNLSRFKHYPLYDAGTAMAKSYLVSTEDQKVYFSSLNQSVEFEKWEPIFTEISRKFTLPLISELSGKAGFRVIRNFLDSKRYFTNSVWMKEG